MPDAPTPLDLDAIEADIAACRTYNFGMYQADRLAHEHAPALVKEAKRLRAEVARLTARPAPAWDEEAIRAARDEYVRHNLGMAVGTYGDRLRCAFEAGVDAVRDHLPVKPGREDMAQALRYANLVEVVAVHEGYGAEEVVYAHLRPVVDAVLAKWPGESRAAVQAEVLRDAVEKYAITIPDALGYKVPAVTTEDLPDRADRLAAEGGADRG